MSDKEALERQTQEQLRNNPGTQKLTDQQADYWKRTVVNNEIDRIRKEQGKS